MEIAFIFGCARSGTSILGELIASHPRVKYKFEAHHIWKKAGRSDNDSHRLTEAHATPAIKRNLRKRFEKSGEKGRLLVEKCPRSALRIPFIREVFPEAKFIHIIRDGRDVACSLLPGVGGSEWRHLKPPSWETLFQKETGVVRGAMVWREVIEIASGDLSGVPHFALKYENLLQDPESRARELLRFLELPEHPAVFEFCRKIQNATADSYQPQEQTKWYRDDHQVRIGRWRENLTKDEARAVEDLLRPLLLRLGYVENKSCSKASMALRSES